MAPRGDISTKYLSFKMVRNVCLKNPLGGVFAVVKVEISVFFLIIFGDRKFLIKILIQCLVP